MVDLVPRPSGLHRLIPCPGSLALEADVPDVSSPYAEEGTLAHSLLEVALVTGLDAADVPDDPEAGFVWPADMRDHIQVALDQIREFPAETLLSERLVDLSPWIPNGSGTADVVAFDGRGVGYLPDLKFGQGVRIWAQDNPQLMAYALGVHNSYGWIYDVDVFRLAIVQPRLNHYDEFEIRLKDLLEWGEGVLKPAVRAALKPGASLNPGEKQCRFCKVRATCKARADWAVRVAFEEFGEMTTPALLSPAEIGDLLGKTKAVRQWIDDVEAYALAQALEGKPLPGWRLVEGRSVRKWHPEAAPALESALAAKGLEPAQAWDRKLIGITAAEKLLGKKDPIFETFTSKPAGAPTLAPISDPRPTFSPETAVETSFANFAKD